MGCLFGELLPHPCGFQEQGRTHVFQEDGGRFLDNLSAVVAADEEQIHFGSRFQYAPDFSHCGIRIGGPVKGENAEQIVDRAGFQGNVLERSVPDLNIAKRLYPARSEEHTSELQSPCNLVCRLLLEKKKKKHIDRYILQYITS